MRKCLYFLCVAILPIILLSSCRSESHNRKEVVNKLSGNDERLSVSSDSVVTSENQKEKDTADTDTVKAFQLTDENAVPFFFEYQKKHKENKVRVTTSMGSFDIRLYDETPYHRSNFIYLTRKGYFDGTFFHRVVKDFIIQGGNSDRVSTAKKRGDIGRYVLPPDTRKGFKHHRGVVSMPSADAVDDPFKLASPYEFFIVVTNPGSYHLDGNYTAFGEVVSGMEVVDKINSVPTDSGEWPLKNVIIEKVTILD